MYRLDKFAYLVRILKTNPSELFRLLRIGLTTAKYHYIKRCVGKRTVVGVRTEIINSANVRIGNDCLLQDGIYIRAGAEGRVIIGDRAALNSFCRLFGHGSIEIGEDTQIGPGSLITTTEHNYHDELTTHFKRVVIGKGAWIGGNVTILPGVEIGDFAVIGAGSVVMKNIPPHCVALGVPARVVKLLDSPPQSVHGGNMEVSGNHSARRLQP
jgi:acetyltransferase-like isoleucine patch superfamily enzyme